MRNGFTCIREQHTCVKTALQERAELEKTPTSAEYTSINTQMLIYYYSAIYSLESIVRAVAIPTPLSTACASLYEVEVLL